MKYKLTFNVFADTFENAVSIFNTINRSWPCDNDLCEIPAKSNDIWLYMSGENGYSGNIQELVYDIYQSIGKGTIADITVHYIEKTPFEIYEFNKTNHRPEPMD